MGAGTDVTAGARRRPELLAPILCDLARMQASGEVSVRGTSMRPTLFPGDRLRVVAATASDVRLGSVVIWRGAEGPTIHLLVGWWWTRDGWRMLTKGDGARRLDPPAPETCLVGVAVALVRAGQVRRLDGRCGRLCGLGRALASLAEGIIVEAWDRGRRAAARWAGWLGW